MKRIERVTLIVKILSDAPCRLYPLNYFCNLFGAAKSSISEDIQHAKQIMESMNLGYIETISGAGGGVKYLPIISDEETSMVLSTICDKIKDSSRILGGGFLYTSDIMFDPYYSTKIGQIFSRQFYQVEADYVITIETKGIPVALMTAKMLNLPLVVIRRESKVSEGSTVSINYFSGSTDQIQKMSLSKRAVAPGKKAIIIDDFMRAGGSLKGIIDMLWEFDVKIAATGVVITSSEPEKKKIKEYFPLILLNKVDEEARKIDISPNCLTFQK